MMARVCLKTVTIRNSNVNLKLHKLCHKGGACASRILLYCCPFVFCPFICFLAALAALGLPWSLTYSFIVMDSKPSSLPDKPKSCKTDGGHEETWPDQQKHNATQRQRQLHLENTSKGNLWDFWPLRHLIRVMRKHDLTNKKDNDEDK